VSKALAVRGKGVEIPQETLQGIRDMYHIHGEHNKAKLQRMFGVSRMTVYRALGKTDPDEAREGRQDKMAKLADSLADQALHIADSIKDIPDNASWSQKAVVLGIITDKIEKIDKRLSESRIEEAMEASPIPETIEALAGALRNELRAIGPMIQLLPVAVEIKQAEQATGHRLIEVSHTIEHIDDLDGGNFSVEPTGNGDPA